MLTEISLTRREFLRGTTAELVGSLLPLRQWGGPLETFPLVSPKVLPFAGELIFDEAERLLSSDCPPGINWINGADLKFRYVLPEGENIDLGDERQKDKVKRLYWEVIDLKGEKLWISPENDPSWQPQLITITEPNISGPATEETARLRAYLVGGQELTASYVLAEKGDQARGGQVRSFIDKKGRGFCFYQSLDGAEVAWLVENKGVLVSSPFKLETILVGPGETIVYNLGWGPLGGFEINDTSGALKEIIDPYTGEGWLPPRPAAAEKEVLKDRAWNWYQQAQKISLSHEKLIGKAIRRVGEVMPNGAFGYSGLTGYIDLLEENPPELTFFVEGKRSGNYPSTLAIGGYALDTDGVYKTGVFFAGTSDGDNFVKRLSDHWGISDENAITDATAVLILKELDSARKMRNGIPPEEVCKDVTSLRFAAHLARFFAVTYLAEDTARKELMDFAQMLDRVPESCSES